MDKHFHEDHGHGMFISSTKVQSLTNGWDEASRGHQSSGFLNLNECESSANGAWEKYSLLRIF